MKTVLIYVTFPNRASALKTTNWLLKNRLIACANIFPVTSHFRWNGKIKKATEVAVLVKTKRALWPMVQKTIEQLHPYDVPVIEFFNTIMNAKAQQWIEREIKKFR